MDLPKPLSEKLNQFCEWMRVMSYSESTVESRERSLKWFLVWCHERNIVSVQEITKPILERYRHYLHYKKKPDNNPLNIRTQLHRLVAVRALFKWLSKNNFILYNPAADLELPRGGFQLPKHVLTIKEAECVLNQPNLNSPLGIRDRAILEVFYSCGIRRQELTRLKYQDVDFDRGTLMVRNGKNKKDRIIPIGERALVWLDKYIWEVRPELVMEPDFGFLFLSNLGGPLKINYLSSRVSSYVKSSAIEKVGSCHLFRHTMATLMLEGGADIRYVQEMLGHANLDTTQIYTQVAITRLKEIHSRTHPAAFLKTPVKPS